MEIPDTAMESLARHIGSELINRILLQDRIEVLDTHNKELQMAVTALTNEKTNLLNENALITTAYNELQTKQAKGKSSGKSSTRKN